MRCKKMVYICDHCGSADLEETDFLFGIPYKHMPDGWISLGKGHLCPTCAEIYRRVSEEVKGEKHEQNV